MKNLLITFGIIITCISTSSADKDHTLNIKVVDEESKQVVENIQLNVYFYHKKYGDRVIYTDSKGIASISWQGNFKYIKITADDTTGIYRRNYSILYKADLQEELISHKVYLSKNTDFNELIAEYRAFDAKIDKENLAKGDTVLFDGVMTECSDPIESEFKGGATAMQQYINRKVSYPQEAIEKNEQGRVYISFIVNTDGTISHVKIDRGVSNTLDFESMRVIYNMPKWIPAKCEGEAVRSVARIPIIYTLE